MAFDFSTLVTDRAMADVLARNDKGTYNAADLNRVDACLEDLVARLGRVGCSVPGYERLKIERTVTPSSRLPDGYTEVQYIQSTGTQYVDTGISAPNGFRILCDVELDSIGPSLQMLFGSHDTNAPYYRNFLATTGNGQWELGVYNAIDFGSAQVGEKYSIDACTISEAIGCTINGVAQPMDTSSVVSTARSARNIYLFALNYTGGLLNATMKLYGLQLYTNSSAENPSRDFVPCIAPGGAVGLYDTVGGQFYANAGSGTFAAGPVVTLETDPEEPTETLDPYTWYESDVPVPSQMARYRANVAAVRAALRLPEGTPDTPETMRRLTVTEANSIEAILLVLNFILNQIHTAVRHCGVTVCGSKGVRA